MEPLGILVQQKVSGEYLWISRFHKMFEYFLKLALSSTFLVWVFHTQIFWLIKCLNKCLLLQHTENSSSDGQFHRATTEIRVYTMEIITVSIHTDTLDSWGEKPFWGIIRFIGKKMSYFLYIIKCLQNQEESPGLLYSIVLQYRTAKTSEFSVLYWKIVFEPPCCNIISGSRKESLSYWNTMVLYWKRLVWESWCNLEWLNACFSFNSRLSIDPFRSIFPCLS